MMVCPLLSWQTCTPHGRGGLVLVTATIATLKRGAVRSLPDAPAAPHAYSWGAVVRDWQSDGGRPPRRRAPYIKTHHYPKL